MNGPEETHTESQSNQPPEGGDNETWPQKTGDDKLFLASSNDNREHAW